MKHAGRKAKQTSSKTRGGGQKRDPELMPATDAISPAAKKRLKVVRFAKPPAKDGEARTSPEDAKAATKTRTSPRRRLSP